MINLYIKYFGRNHQTILFKDRNFELSHQKTIISGSNGSGKTSLALLLSGIIPFIEKCHFFGNQKLDNKEYSLSLIQSNFHFKLQNPSFNFLSLNVDDILDAKNRSNFNFIFPNSNIRNNQEIYKLSEGQKQMLSLYLSLTSSKKYIFLDEPFEYLDLTASKSLVRIINTSDKRLVIINHKEEYNKQIKEFHRIQLSREYNISPSFLSLTNKLNNELQLSIQNNKFSVDYLEINIPNIQIHQGEIIFLKGSNGSGKTSLCKAISGLIHSNLKFIFNGQKVSSKKMQTLSKMAFQNPDFQLFSNDIYTELKTVLVNNNLKNKLDAKIEFAKNIFSRLTSIIDPYKLSFGQKKLFSILTTYLLEPEILILDEPFSSLDGDSIQIVVNLLTKHMDRKGSIIISTHNNLLLQNKGIKIIDLDKWN